MSAPTESPSPVRVRTEISYPDSPASVREIDWNDRTAVHRFSRAARKCLLAGGSVHSSAVRQ